MIVVDASDGDPVLLAHEARILAAVRLVQVDQAAAEIRLQDARHDQHRGGGISVRRGDHRLERGDRALARIDREPSGDAQRGVEQQPVRPVLCRRAFAAQRAVKTRDRPVIIEEPAHARQVLRHRAALHVGGIGGHAEEAGGAIVEQVAVRGQHPHRPRARRMRRSACQQQQDRPPCRGVKGITWVAVERRGMKPGRLIARKEQIRHAFGYHTDRSAATRFDDAATSVQFRNAALRKTVIAALQQHG